MTRHPQSANGFAAAGLAAALVFAPAAGLAQAPGQSSSPYVFQVTSSLVVVSVTVRDRKGQPVRGLTKNDFALLEDGKPQAISTFDYEKIGSAPPVEAAEEALPPATPVTLPAPQKHLAAPSAVRNRRLVVLFFDLTSIQPEDLNHAVQAARNYVARQMTPADLVAVVSLSTSLEINLDFSRDRVLLDRVLATLNAPNGEGFEAGSTGSTEDTPDTGGSFTPDDTEFNIFDTDRELAALQSLADMLGGIDEKKSVVYFSGGLTRTGIENQTALRAATNALVRANVAVYPLDVAGLQALPPGGEAQNASLRGTSPYSGASVLNQLSANFGSEETLYTLASDTGGHAFLDTNNFNTVFTRVQQDSEEYYVLGYHSTNLKRDGKFRKITVRCKVPGLKLEYRSGYYAATDYGHLSRQNRERQLQDELTAAVPDTDLPIYLAAGYFRLGPRRYYVPVSVALPGDAISLRSPGPGKPAVGRLDIAGQVIDELGQPVGQARHTVDLDAAQVAAVRGKNLQYDTGFLLAPGSYRLRFVVRDDGAGTIGSFEAILTLPQIAAAPGSARPRVVGGHLEMSSVWLGSQLKPASKASAVDPMAWKGREIVPNVTHVFARDQRLYFFYEVYDPAQFGRNGPIQLLSNVEFLRGGVKTYETSEVEMRHLNAPDRSAAVFEFDVPLAKLLPGLYTCQVNVIDAVANRFAFPRLAVLVRPAPAPAAAPVKSGR